MTVLSLSVLLDLFATSLENLIFGSFELLLEQNETYLFVKVLRRPDYGLSKKQTKQRQLALSEFS